MRTIVSGSIVCYVFLTLTHVFYELLASRDFTKLLAKSVVTEGHR